MKSLPRNVLGKCIYLFFAISPVRETIYMNVRCSTKIGTVLACFSNCGGEKRGRGLLPLVGKPNREVIFTYYQVCHTSSVQKGITSISSATPRMHLEL